MKSNTSAAALGFGGILQKIAIKEKSEFNFYPSAFLSKCVLQSLTSRALPLRAELRAPFIPWWNQHLQLTLKLLRLFNQFMLVCNSSL